MQLTVRIFLIHYAGVPLTILLLEKFEKGGKKKKDFNFLVFLLSSKVELVINTHTSIYICVCVYTYMYMCMLVYVSMVNSWNENKYDDV